MAPRPCVPEAASNALVLVDFLDRFLGQLVQLWWPWQILFKVVAMTYAWPMLPSGALRCHDLQDSVLENDRRV